MGELDAEHVAKRLGLSEALIRRLQARGQLELFALSDTEIRKRLYNAHWAFVLADRRMRGHRAAPSGRPDARHPTAQPQPVDVPQSRHV